MATAKKSNTYAELDDEGRFLVELAAPVQIGRTWARPGQRVEMKGRTIKEHAANVAAVRPLAN